MPDDQLVALALRLVDGEPIEWDAAAATAFVPAAEVEALRLIEAVARLHHAEVRASVPIHDAGAGAEAPRRWGPLQIHERIGTGAYGDVYRATDARLGRDVALKLLRHRDPASDDESSLVREGHLLARVRHPNVVTVHGAERLDGWIGLWMELVDGETLEQELTRRGPLPWREVVEIGRALAGALAAVHHAGLLHRDIKAQNVMRESGRVVLMDFGAGDDARHDIGPGGLAGTPAYLAPEVLAGRPASVASDIYALGVLLYRLVTAALPVTGESLDAVRRQHREGARPDVRGMCPDLPRAFAAVIMRALDPDPERRFADAATLEKALARAAAGPLWRRRTAVGSLIAVVLLATAVAGWYWRAGSPRDRLAFQSRDLVLITRFENRTDEPVFDGGIEYALERELLESDTIGLVPGQRVHDALQMMKRPADTVITAQVGREIAARDGRIRAVLGGHVVRSGDRYVLTAQLIHPADGAVVATEIEEAAAPAGVLQALSQLGRRVRRALGERLPQLPRAAPPEPGTTHSLAAFQLYNRAVDLGRAGQWDASLAVSREAVQADAEFASGWIWLAWSHWFRQPAPRSRDVPELQAALDRATGLTAASPEWEQRWIAGSAHFLRREFEGAVEQFRALLTLRPDHYAAADRLAESLLELGRRGESVDVFARISDLRPLDVNASFRAASTLLAATGEKAATPYVDRTRTTIQNADGRFDYTRAALWVAVFDAYHDWRRRDVVAARQRIDAIVERYRARMAAPTLFAAGYFYASLGLLDRADALLLSRADPVFRDLHSLYIPTIRGDHREAMTRLRRLGKLPNQVLRPTNYLDLGLVSDARRVLAASPQPRSDLERAFHEVARGRLALTDGRLDEAVATLTAARISLERSPVFTEYHQACRYLAEALDRLGRSSEAIPQLEGCVTKEPFLLESGQFAATLWLENRLALADLYRAQNRVTDARGLEADLQRLLAVADADHPLRRRLLGRQ